MRSTSGRMAVVGVVQNGRGRRMRKYRVTQLRSHDHVLPKFRVEVWRKPWFRAARWKVVKVYHYHDDSTFIDDTEHDTKEKAYAIMNGFIKEDLEDQLRKKRYWLPVA